MSYVQETVDSEQPQGLAPLLSDVFLRPPTARRMPIVADTNALISDVLHHAKHGFSFLTLLAEEQLISLLCPAHVDEEMTEHLPAVAARSPQRDAVLATWDLVHRPVIRFVETTADDFPQNQAVRAVAANDLDDEPLVRLGLLVASAMVLCRDPDVTDAGVGIGEWVAPARALIELARLEEEMYGQARLMNLLLLLTGRLIGWAGKLAARQPFVAGLAVGVTAAMLVQRRDGVRAALGRFGNGLSDAGEQLSPAIENAFARHAAASRAVHATLMLPAEDRPLPARIARVLAEFGAPTPMSAITVELQRLGHDVEEPEVRAVLREHPAFTLARGRGWQLATPG